MKGLRGTRATVRLGQFHVGRRSASGEDRKLDFNANHKSAALPPSSIIKSSERPAAADLLARNLVHRPLTNLPG